MAKFLLKTTPERSHVMKRIKGKDTIPEIILRKTLWQRGIRYRKNNKHILGQPDISIKKHRIAIFIDGEFWHGFKWEEKKQKIKINREYWIEKIERNIQRDRIIDEKLRAESWVVFRFWSSEVLKNPDYCTELVASEIKRKQGTENA